MNAEVTIRFLQLHEVWPSALVSNIISRSCELPVPWRRPASCHSTALSLSSHHRWKGRSFRHFLSQHQRKEGAERRRSRGKRLHRARPPACFPMLRSSLPCVQRKISSPSEWDLHAERQNSKAVGKQTAWWPRCFTQTKCADSGWSWPLSNFFLINVVFPNYILHNMRHLSLTLENLSWILNNRIISNSNKISQKTENPLAHI